MDAGAGPNRLTELLLEARERGVELWTEGQRLRYRGPESGLPPDLRERLAERRDELVARIQVEEASRHTLGELAGNQVGLWHIQRLSPESSAYNVGHAAVVRGRIDEAALTEAVQVILDRHEALRTDYPEVRGEPRRRVVGFLRAHVLESVLPPGADLAVELRRLTGAPFPLDEGPTVRIHRIRGPDRDALLIVAHHLTLDGQSIVRLARELVAVYRAVIDGVPPPAAEADRREYSDFVAWQKEWLTASGPEAARHWRDVLDPPPPLLNLPLDRPTPKVRGSDGATVSWSCPAELAHRVRDMAHARGATPFQVLLTAYTAFLRRLTGQHDVTVGTPVHGRSALRFSKTVGDLSNFIPIRTAGAPDCSFLGLLDEVRGALRMAMPYQDYPLPLMAWDLSRNGPGAERAIQTSFALPEFRLSDLRGAPVTEDEGLDLDVEAFPFDHLEGQFGLSLDVFPVGEAYRFAWRFDRHVLDEGTVRSWATVFERLLRAVVDEPDLALSAISLSEDRRASGLAGPERPLGGPMLPGAVVRMAERMGDRVAVESDTGSYSYEGLVAAAEAVTAELAALGVGPGDRVGVMLERGRELVAALLGIAGSGAAYVPMDPRYPVTRLRYMLEDSGAAALVTHRGLEQRLETSIAVVDLDTVSGAERMRFREVEAEQAAYVIYTSGSTGQPKGVEIPHGAVMNFLRSMAEEPGLTESDTLLAVTTVSFDISVLELYLPLLVGARVVIADEAETVDGRRLAERLDAAEVTVMQATPSTWKLLLASGWTGKADLRVLCGGETLSAGLAEELVGRGAEVWNLYGPTETTVWSTVQRVEGEGPVLIGRPIANTTVYVLDERLEPLPIGVPGELYIGGAGLAKRYVGLQELTAERFVDSPFDSGQRLYRTGDLVRLRHDGRLEHLGRLDDQVKVRGFRIELGEVEAALRDLPDVLDAVVTARDDRLVAYVVHADENAPTMTELRSALRETLPDYMVPSLVVPLAALPLTPNGKVDRARLPDATEGTTHRSDPDPPAGPVELEIAAVWSSLLDIEAVNAGDNFFELGGHSLLAMEAVALLEERTGLRLDPRELFFKNLRQLAMALPKSD